MFCLKALLSAAQKPRLSICCLEKNLPVVGDLRAMRLG